MSRHEVLQSRIDRLTLARFLEAVQSGRRTLDSRNLDILREAVAQTTFSERAENRAEWQEDWSNSLGQGGPFRVRQLFDIIYTQAREVAQPADWRRFEAFRIEATKRLAPRGSWGDHAPQGAEESAKKLLLAGQVKYLDGLATGGLIPTAAQAMAAAKRLMVSATVRSTSGELMRESWGIVIAAPEFSWEVRYIIGGSVGAVLLDQQWPPEHVPSMVLESFDLNYLFRQAMGYRGYNHIDDSHSVAFREHLRMPEISPRPASHEETTECIRQLADDDERRLFWWVANERFIDENVAKQRADELGETVLEGTGSAPGSVWRTVLDGREAGGPVGPFSRVQLEYLCKFFHWDCDKMRRFTTPEGVAGWILY